MTAVGAITQNIGVLKGKQAAVDMLEDKSIDNFAFAGLVVVYGVPADEKFEEQRRILSPKLTSNFRVLLLHKIAFESILVTRRGLWSL